MRPRLKLIGLTMATLVLALAASSLPMSHTLLPVFAQTSQPGKAEADRLLKEGDAQLNAGKTEAALPLLKQALKLYQESNDRAGEGQALKSIGAVYLSLNQNEKAITAFQSSLAIAREIKNQDLETRSLNNLGYVYEKLNETKEAIISYRQSIAVSKSSQNWTMLSASANNLRNLYNRSKRYKEAIAVYDDILPVLERSGQKFIVANSLLQLGSSYAFDQQYEKAITLCQKSLMIEQEIKNPGLEASALNLIAGSYYFLYLGKDVLEGIRRSDQFYLQALQIYRRAGDKLHKIVPLNNLQLHSIWRADVLEERGFMTEANAEYEQALKYAQEILLLLKESDEVKPVNAITEELPGSNKDIQINAKFAAKEIMARYYIYTKDYPHAEKTFESLVAEARRNNLIDKEQSALNYLDSIYGKQSRYRDSLVIHIRNLELARIQRNSYQVFSSLAFLSGLYSALGEYQTALQVSEQALSASKDVDIKNLSFLRQNFLALQTSEYENQVNIYGALGNFEKGSALVGIWIKEARSTKIPEIEATTLLDAANNWYNSNTVQQYDKAIEVATESLDISRKIKDRSLEVHALIAISNSYLGKNQNDLALSFINQALTVAKKAESPTLESDALYPLVDLYNQAGDFKKSIETALRILELSKDTEQKIYALNAVSQQYLASGNVVEAARFSEAALKQAQDTSSSLEILSLNYLGQIYTASGEFEKSAKIAQAIFEKTKENDSYLAKRVAYSTLVTIYGVQGELEKQVEFAQKTLVLDRAAKATPNEATDSILLAQAYGSQGDYQKSLEFTENALTLAHKLKRKDLEVQAIRWTADIYRFRHQYQKAIAAAQEAITIEEKLNQPISNDSPKTTLAQTYYELGDYDKAASVYLDILSTARQRNNRSEEGVALLNLSDIYGSQNHPKQALETAQQASVIFQQINHPFLQALSNERLGIAHAILGNEAKATELLQSFLAFTRTVKNLAWERESLTELASLKRKFGHSQEAIKLYQQALSIPVDQQVAGADFAIYSELGNIYRDANQPAIAIIFYKQAINQIQVIRQGITGLPRQLQTAFLQSTVDLNQSKPTDTYRALADLLIQQRRLPEAQAVLELLKLRELRDFTRDANIKAPGVDSPGISLANIEATTLKNLLKQFTTVGNFTQKIADCEAAIKCDDLKQLRYQRDQLNRELDQELITIRAAFNNYYKDEPSTLKPEDLNGPASNIVAQTGTVLIYPLVLKDKIQFLLALKAGKGAVTFRPFEKQISADQLFTTIQQLREQLKTPGDLKALQETSGKLYEWLIRPLETELNNPNIKHIVFAPDSITRYIPLAALYDRKRNQYLIQRYSISTITAASLTNTTETVPKPTSSQPILLAMGASVFPDLPSLSNVPAELDAITKTSQRKDSQGIYPGSEFLNNDFDYDTLQTKLADGNYRILHIATHSAFVAGNVESSYLVLGRGGRLRTDQINELRSYGIQNIHLVVLSACETAVGDRASDGTEIPGISYFFLKNEVKAVMASLWSVSDPSTALIMQQFYTHIASGMTKAESLQQVQQDFIQHKLTSQNTPFTRASVRPLVAGQSAPGDFSHPYYWAPFILIGNSL